jgi:adenine phosphoribosyltransferase
MSEPFELKRYIRSIPDFPKPGIMFRDITPLLAAPQAFQHVIDSLADHYRKHRVNASSRPRPADSFSRRRLAFALKAKFIPVRKPGKLALRHALLSLRVGIRQRIRSKCTSTRWRRPTAS